MNKAELYFTAFIVILVAIAGGIAYFWSPHMLLQVVAFLFFLGTTIGFLGIGLLSLYAENVKFTVLSLVPAVILGYTTYLTFVWEQTMVILGVFILLVLAVLFGIWWISEPNLSFSERMRSAGSLKDKGNYRAAARKYEKSEDYENAAECYEEIGQSESAAWAYEKAENYEKAAMSYENVEDEDPYHWKEAYENWKKADNKFKAAEALERYAEEEPWYWEDVAELWEEVEKEDVDSTQRAEEAWKKMINYYEDESEEEGVFWEDVAKGYEKIGEEESAEKAWTKFAGYCEEQAEKDGSWWKHVAEAYEELGNEEKVKEAEENYEEFEESIES